MINGSINRTVNSYMKIRKYKFTAPLFVVILCVAAAALALTICFAAISGTSAFSAEEQRLTVSKTEFEYGEPILITAYGKGLDWVGIYAPDGTASILWVYIDENTAGGVGNGVEFDIIDRGVINNGAEYADITPGEYIVRLMPDNTSDLSRAIETIKIKVLEQSAPAGLKPPSGAEYTPAGNGFAAGTLKVELPEDSQAKDVQPYWADGNGILSDYMPLPKFKVKKNSAVYVFPESVIIPEGATELWIYTLGRNGKRSDECFKLTLPEGSDFKNSQKPGTEFQVISDIHITQDNAHVHNQHFRLVLEDISKLSPESIGIFIDGDIADTGNEAEYELMTEMYQAQSGIPPLFLAIGNHDLYNGTMEEKTALFLRYAKKADGTHPSGLHYDFYLKGFHFVFLGNDELVRGVDTTLNENTLKWLKNVLEKDRDASRPVFLFIHQSLYDTVAGSLPGQNWNGVHNEDAFRELIYNYPEIIMFNGHSHWTMDSERNGYLREGYPSIFNTASTAYLWTSYNIITGENLNGSQGYYIEIYDDMIMIRGRDFANSKWIPAAQYCLTGYSGLISGSTEPSEPSERNTSGDSKNIILPVIICCAGAVLIAAVVLTIVFAKKRKKSII